MNEQKKDMHQTDTLECSICHKTFHSQEERQKHNREFHPQGQMKDQGHTGHAGSGSEEQRSRSEKNPNFDKGQERKAPGSEHKQSEHKRSDEEHREFKQKRAAS